MNKDEMVQRTKEFAIRVVKLYRSLPASKDAQIIGLQVFRSGTSVGANYRAACRGRSRPDFISKLGIALEEVDESLYWMELLIETKIISAERLQPLMSEANEITAILVTTIKSARQKKS
jgi:four helix bundle protein